MKIAATPYMCALFLLASASAWANQAPIAKAGADQSVAAGAECTAIVILDGSQSSDPDGGTLTFEWTGPFVEDGALQTILGVKATATLPIGENYEFILTVRDGAGGASTDSVLVSVADKTPPILTLSASPNTLWPPNHKMVPITISATATDGCSEVATPPKIVSVGSNEPLNGVGDGNTDIDWEITGDLTLNLRSERAGPGNGRIYTITIEASDSAGNVASQTVTVKVPHDQGKGDDDDDDVEEGDFRTYTQEDWGGADSAAVEYLLEKFDRAFPNGLKIGAGPSGLSGNSATFTTPEAILAFLPASGTPAPLALEYIDPLQTTGGELAGHAVALTLNIEFDSRDRKFGASKALLKDIVIVDESDPAFGKTVYEVLQMANAYLGGGTTVLDGPTLTASLKKINESYRGGENCDLYVKPCGTILTEDDCDGAKDALKQKLGKLYEKLCRIFDRDGDGELTKKEKKRLNKSKSEFKKLKKAKEKKAKKAKKAKDDDDD